MTTDIPTHLADQLNAAGRDLLERLGLDLVESRGTDVAWIEGRSAQDLLDVLTEQSAHSFARGELFCLVAQQLGENAEGTAYASAWLTLRRKGSA